MMREIPKSHGAWILAIVGVLVVWGGQQPCVAENSKPEVPTREPVSFVDAARMQVGVVVKYDSAYRALAYPMGDVAPDVGVCTDVVIRAMRVAFKMDLQTLVHEDMKANFSQYPKLWGAKATDKNIDHRRVPNLQTFFKRRGWELKVSREMSDYLAGDVVTCTVPPNLPHIMVVSDKRNADGRPLVIHNIGRGTQEEDVLQDFKLTGHYRIPRGAFEKIRNE